MTSTENVNKLCLFVQEETEHLQVKLTMMVCPERISNVYNFTDVGFILIQHSGRKHELAGRMLISSCRPEAGKQSLLASAIFFITLILFERSNERFETFGATDQDHSQTQISPSIICYLLESNKNYTLNRKSHFLWSIQVDFDLKHK